MAIPHIHRRILFYSLIAVFLIVTPIVIAIAVGNSLDIRAFSFVPAGGIFVKTNQTGIRIFVDGAPYRETSFITSGALVNALSPDMHHIRIEKDGYRPWEKTIEVRHGRVSEYRTIMLIPLEPPAVGEIMNEQKGPFTYLVSPDGGEQAIIVQKEEVLMMQGIPSGDIFFQKKLATSPEHIEWIDDSTLLVRASSDRGEAHLYRVGDNGIVEEIVLRFLKTVKRQAVIEVRSHPTDQEALFLLGEDRGLYRYRISDGAIEPLMNQVVHFETYGDRISFITEKGFFVTADASGRDIQIIGRPGLFVNGQFASYPADAGLVAIIDGVSGFFIFQEFVHSIDPTTTGVKNVSFGEDGKMALLQRERDLLVLFLEKEKIMPFRERLTVAKIIGDEKHELIDSTWYNDSYIVFTTSEGLFGAEIGLFEGDYMVQKLAPESGYISTDGATITIVNTKGLFTYAIE